MINFELQTYKHKPIKKKGICIWLTGLPCSGKTTIASKLKEFFASLGCSVTLIDGDVIREFLSNKDFSYEARKKNNLLAGYIASEIVKHGGIVICALVSPYERVREQVKAMFKEDEFLLVYLSTPLQECIKRDVKGMYQKALKGEIKKFTGINDVYEEPFEANVVIDTSQVSLHEALDMIIDKVFLIFKKKNEKTSYGGGKH